MLRRSLCIVLRDTPRHPSTYSLSLTLVLHHVPSLPIARDVFECPRRRERSMIPRSLRNDKYVADLRLAVPNKPNNYDGQILSFTRPYKSRLIFTFFFSLYAIGR